MIRRISWDIVYHETVDSTNVLMIDTINTKNQINEGYVIKTDFQTTGKGQIGNYWESEAGKNILVSLHLTPQIDIADQFQISKVISLAIVALLTELDIENVTIKWPNDVYVGDKKIAGILIQNILQGKDIKNCVIGIGLNINQEAFQSDAPNPTSIKLELGKEIDRDALLLKLLDHIEQMYQKLYDQRSTEIDNLYKFLMYRRNVKASFRSDDGTIFEGIIKDVNESGQLMIEMEAGMRNFGFREVRYIL